MKKNKFTIKNSLKAISYKLEASSGFTLLESLVAIAIFTAGVSTAVFLVIQSIQVGDKIQRRVVAAHLAQEGIEVVRNIRDSNWLKGNSWTGGILTNGAPGCATYNGTSIDVSCSSGGYLVFDGSHYVSTSTAMSFYRTASTTLIAPDQLLVEVNITCGNNCNIKLEEYLYDWK